MIISKRFLDNFKPGDVIPDGYYPPESIAHKLKHGRIVIVADEVTKKVVDYDNLTISELRAMVKAQGLKVSIRSKKAMIEALTNGDS
jgi:hypothetical protein